MKENKKTSCHDWKNERFNKTFTI